MGYRYCFVNGGVARLQWEDMFILRGSSALIESVSGSRQGQLRAHAATASTGVELQRLGTARP